MRGAAFGDAAAQLGHAADPAIIVFCLQLHVIRHFRVRQDDEGFGLQTLDRGIDALFRGQHAIDIRAGKERALRHAGRHALRAQYGNPDAVILAGNGKTFGKADGGMLGGGIDCRADLAEQAGRRHGVQKIPAAALQIERHQRTCRIDMCHDMHAPASRPGGVRRGGRIVEIRIGRDDTGIGAEQADRPNCFGGAHQGLDVFLDRHITMERGGLGADRRGGGLGRLRVQIGADDMRGAQSGGAFGELTAYAAAGAGDDNDLACDFHGVPQIKGKAGWAEPWAGPSPQTPRLSV
jgi:hypothetical protein